MWKLMIRNENHGGKEFMVLKSSCLPLLRFLMWNLDDIFPQLGYKSFKVWIQHMESGGVING